MSRILVAEDNPITAEMISVRLASAGHEVMVATDGRQTLERAASGNPDLILLDVMMPELDGFQVLQELRRDPLLGAIPVVMVSARSQEHDILLALSMGAEDYVTKPFSFRELLARVDRVLSEGAGHLRATVRDGLGRAWVGELVHGDAEHVSLRFHLESTPTFAIGDQATISMRSVAMHDSIELEATVKGRSESEPHRIYRLGLHQLATRDSEITNAFLRLIGRRGAYRVAFDPDDPVRVQILAERSGEALELQGALSDLSATGACLVTKADADRLLFCVDSFTVCFRLPGSDSPLEMPVSIRHRRAHGDGIAYGIRFDTSGSPELLEQLEEIADFVFSRQRTQT
jgi:DNA-binding response OmpR family regulator